MATNVTEKDKALQEVIDWLKDQLDQEQDSIHCAQADGTCDDLIGDSVIRALTFAKCIKHCQSMLGYSGSMPSEVPNQSEGREMSSQYKVCPLF